MKYLTDPQKEQVEEPMRVLNQTSFGKSVLWQMETHIE